MSSDSLSTVLDELLELASVGAMMIGGIAFLAILGIQTYGWMEHGWWQERSALNVVAMFNSEWAQHPQHLLGLHKIAAWFNEGAAYLISGFAVAGLVEWIRAATTSETQTID